MADLYLCVDCGGTKTSAAISDIHGTIIGRGAGGPSNITYLTVDVFIASVRSAVLSALKEASSECGALPPTGESPFAAAWFGISGADSPAAIAKVTPAISDLLAIPAGPNLTIANDTQLLASPIRLYSDVTHAIAVIAGTGSIAVGFKQEDGRIKELGRVGGWGWILGDEGGGYDVGRETLRQLLLEEDLASVRGQPSPPSKLRDRILEKFNVATVMEILGEVYHPDPQTESSGEGMRSLPREKRLSSIPPLAFTAAFEDDDWLAKRILEASAKQLVGQIAALLGDGEEVDPSRRIRAQSSVISFGGSLVGIEKYRQIILDQLAERGHSFPHSHFVEDAAVAGAISLTAASRLNMPWPSPMKWETFLKLMTQMGFTYEITGGSSVRFDPPDNQSSSITIHKPHPDTTVTPVHLIKIAKRMRRYYGWKEEDFITGANAMPSSA
ncbi:hypothetical protein D9611_000308 [Ephemerocybe angulata]|uniref:N-acetyl-D-glucosamine kinase n=1 Tax=Ephemerocybe angulata TaxID=980116 RepID=A0A8H5BPD2_9AGAR|nr:hypothetical protein D9611_000308 [Tulosesus angulatus]